MSVLIGHARGGDPTYTPGDQTGADTDIPNELPAEETENVGNGF